MINNMEIIEATIPLTPTNPKQEWLNEWNNQLFVKIKDDAGREGIGEILIAAANSRKPYIALLEKLKPILMSSDERNIKSIWNSLRKVTFTSGYGISTGVLSGIDIALWDLMGKRLNENLSVIAGKYVDYVPRYASLSRYKSTEDVLKVVESLFKQGYTSIKLHQTSEDTIESVKLIREKFGYGFDLMVDLNCSMFQAKALEFARKISKYELKWIEEPVWPPDDYSSLKKINKIIPVAAGENFFSIFEFRNLLENDCLSVYQPDVTKIGGISPMLEIMGLLKSYNAYLSFHNRPHNGWVGIMASANLAATYNGETIIETPPNEPPESIHIDGNVEKNKIILGGEGLGISISNDLPVSEKEYLLKFHK